MVMMPLALVRLMAEYARAEDTDYGNMFVSGCPNDTTDTTLYLLRLPDVADEYYDDARLTRLDELERKYDIHINSYGNFTTVKNVSKDACSCHLCKCCENAAEDNDNLCEDCLKLCMCRDCEEFLDECSCRDE